MTTIMDCIEEIPERLKKILDGQNELFDKLSNNLINKKYSKIVIVASGSSNNAASAVKRFGIDLLGKEIDIIYPNLFVNDLPRKMLSKNALYIFISQTGSTKLVLDALKIVNEMGGDTVSITEDLYAPIAKEANISIEMGSGKEAFVFRTIGYSSSILTLAQIFMYLAKAEKLVSTETLNNINKDILIAIKNLPRIKEETLKWFEENEDYLETKTNYIFSGTKDLWPIAIEADIKFMEMLPVLSNSFELEELIHGPQNMFKEEYLIFLLVKEDIGSEKANHIAEFVQNEVGNASIVVADHKVNTPHLQITSESQWFYTLEYITVFQILAYKLGLKNNRDYTKGVYPNVTKYVSKSVE